MKQTGEGRWEAELYRLQGKLLQFLPTDHTAEAQACLHRALEVACHQHAKSWELRAATPENTQKSRHYACKVTPMALAGVAFSP